MGVSNHRSRAIDRRGIAGAGRTVPAAQAAESLSPPMTRRRKSSAEIVVTGSRIATSVGMESAHSGHGHRRR